MKKNKSTPKLLVEMKGIYKAFPGVVAIDGVDFSLEEGEIHSLLGENGAGKSTLMSILSGLYRPDRGEIYWQGERKVTISSPYDARCLGIAMIYQHFHLVEEHTITENIILGSKLPFNLSLQYYNEEIKRLGEKFNLSVKPTARIKELTIAEQQKVEILKALYNKVKLLIMDEPTAVLTPQETDKLFSILREMSKSGVTIVFISHKLSEIMAIADRITVLRRGKKVGTFQKQEVTPEKLAHLMVGELPEKFKSQISYTPKKDILKVTNLFVKDLQGNYVLKNISFTLKEGEILGIAAVSGNGQNELMETLAGIRKIFKGEIILNGKRIEATSARRKFLDGIHYIPADRKKVGTIGNLDIIENLAMRKYFQKQWQKHGMLIKDRIKDYFLPLINEYKLKLTTFSEKVKTLSGGNLQKLLLIRELDTPLCVLLAEYPTHGLDLEATQRVWNIIKEKASLGVGVIIVSEDLEELFSLSHRLAVMFKGEIVDIIDRKEATIEKIGLLMAGIKHSVNTY